MEKDNKYRVLVDDNFHYHDEDYRREAGEYDSEAEAVSVCRQISKASLDELYEPGMKAHDLIAKYQALGDDPWILGPEAKNIFSAWEYVEKNAKNYILKKKLYAD